MGFWDDKKPKPENFATKDDIKDLRQDIDRMRRAVEPVKTEGATKKVIRNVGRGMSVIGKSLATPNTGRRMKIGQLPSKKPPIARSNIINPIAGNGAGIKRRRISYAPED